MAWCLSAPSHYLNQCWLIISEVLWHSPQGSFMWNNQDIYIWYVWKLAILRLQLHLESMSSKVKVVFSINVVYLSSILPEPVQYSLKCLYMTVKSLSNRLFAQQPFQAYPTKNQSSISLALCEEHPPVTSGCPSQRANNVENISMSERHHVDRIIYVHWALITLR